MLLSQKVHRDRGGRSAHQGRPWNAVALGFRSWAVGSLWSPNMIRWGFRTVTLMAERRLNTGEKDFRLGGKFGSFLSAPWNGAHGLNQGHTSLPSASHPDYLSGPSLSAKTSFSEMWSRASETALKRKTRQKQCPAFGKVLPYPRITHLKPKACLPYHMYDKLWEISIFSITTIINFGLSGNYSK